MPFTPRPPVAAPPSWCGGTLSEHGERSRANAANRAGGADGAAPDHGYVAADGFESEAFDAW
jgi:hypothetical protein